MPGVFILHWGRLMPHSRLRLHELRPLARLAAPIAFSHMANYFMQIVDTIFVGKLGAVSLGGVSLGSGLFAIIMMIAVGILLGLDYRVSHAFGAKKHDECGRLLTHGFYLAFLLAVPLMILLEFCANHFQFFGIAPDLSAEAGAYLKTMTFSLLPFLLFTVCRQFLQATGTAGPILVVFIIANVINAFGNWVFIYGHLGFPAMGVAGSGLSTTISRTIMLILLFGYTLVHNRRMKLSLREAGLGFQRRLMRDLLSLGIPASGQLILEVGVFVTSTFMIGHLGAIQLAAHQIVLQIASFTFMMPMGISAASAVVVGQALGARQPERAVRQGWMGIGLGTAVMAVSGVVLFFLATPILRAFTQEESVIVIARQLILMAAFFQIFDGAQVVATGSLRGAGNTRASLIANFIGHWLIGLPIGLMLCFWMHWNALGIWVGLVIGLATVATILTVFWRHLSPSLVQPLPEPA
jgi:MATE family multidrug resistance protein